MEQIIELILNSDEAIIELITTYGSLVYLILFSIIFIETGLVIANFLPGDTALFSAGMMAASGELNLSLLLLILSVATILGNTSNFLIGNYFGMKFFKTKRARRNKHIDKSIKYFEKNSTKAIVVSRFIPFFRSLIPFIAGISSMKLRTFTTYNILGGILWIFTYVLMGFFFGTIPWVKSNYGLIMSGVVILFILALMVGMLRPAFYFLSRKVRVFMETKKVNKIY